jgi:hypothetical protein
LRSVVDGQRRTRRHGIPVDRKYIFTVSIYPRCHVAADAGGVSFGATSTVSNAGTTGPNAGALHGASKPVFRPASDIWLNGCTTDFNQRTSSSPILDDGAATGSTLRGDTLHSSADADYAGSARHCVLAVGRWAAAAF